MKNYFLVLILILIVASFFIITTCKYKETFKQTSEQRVKELNASIDFINHLTESNTKILYLD